MDTVGLMFHGDKRRQLKGSIKMAAYILRAVFGFREFCFTEFYIREKRRANVCLESQYQVGEDCRQLSWVLVYIYVPIAMMFHFVIGFLVKY